jgi:hypothetical protein
MVLTSRCLVALAVAGLLVAPVYADVVPSQYASKSAAKETVQGKLTDMGLNASEASARAARLMESEATYLAGDDHRLQVVGQEMFGGQSDNLWWEWVLGIGAMAGAAGVLVLYAND